MVRADLTYWSSKGLPQNKGTNVPLHTEEASTLPPAGCSKHPIGVDTSKGKSCLLNTTFGKSDCSSYAEFVLLVTVPLYECTIWIYRYVVHL